jgi:DNA damage-binding protein 1
MSLMSLQGPEANFCVGTFFFREEEREPSAGRVLVLAAKRLSPHTMHTSLAASHPVSGCVYALTLVNDLIVAAVNTSVCLAHLLLRRC